MRVTNALLAGSFTSRITQNIREISDVQLQQNIAITQRNVKSAYFYMMYAVGNIYVVDWGQVVAFTPSGAFASR